MRANEFIRDEDKLDEILPLIGMAAGGAARVAGGLVGRAAMGVGKAALRGAGALARGAVTSLAKDDDEQQPADPNAKVGVQPSNATAQPPASNTTPATKPAAAPAGGATIANLKPGTNIEMPTNKGQMSNFKVTRVTANDVEIENPDKLKNPTEPDRIVYNKRDLAKALGTK